jgi:hypothetical protein
MFHNRHTTTADIAVQKEEDKQSSTQTWMIVLTLKHFFSFIPHLFFNTFNFERNKSTLLRWA